MFSEIGIRQFKCFEHLQLPLAHLTLLTGVNASGKSSVLQTLALLKQSLNINTPESTLILNDAEGVMLGTTGDVVNAHNRRGLQFSIHSEKADCIWGFRGGRRALSIPIANIRWRDETTEWEWQETNAFDGFLPAQPSPAMQWLEQRLRDIHYISADRVGPREVYPIAEPTQYATVGVRGERAAWLIDQHDFLEVSPALRHPNEIAPFLPQQINAWMNHFFPGAMVEVRPIDNANLVTLGIRTSNETDFHRPQNVGYGLTHLLPILVMCLVATTDDLLLIENPEAHLHPSGQSAIGEFLAIVAATGVQIVVETHSDHVLNGLRKAVKRGQIAPDQAYLHFFTAKTPQVISPSLDRKGNIDHWPQGFFDQLDKDMEHLIDWGE